MTATTLASTLGLAAHNVAAFGRQSPVRMRERSFWLIQAMVLAITAVHLLIEASPYSEPYGYAHHIPVTLYVIPIVYAGLRYRTEGSLLTGLLCVGLTVPSIVIWHRATGALLGELAQVATVLGIGAVIAWRVEREATQRRRAEETSTRLALLNEVATAVSHHVSLAQNLEAILEKVADALAAHGAWISLAEGAGRESASISRVGRLGADWRRCSELAVRERRAVTLQGRLTAVPLVAEGRTLGTLGVSVAEERRFSQDEMDLLHAIGSQIGVALENARLYREEQEATAEQRRIQEALRDYARRVTQAQEEERKRMARELHDDTAHALLVLCRNLDSLRHSGAKPPAASAPQLDEAYEMARTTLRSIRRFSRDLRPSVLDDLGLIPAIEWLTSEISARAAIAASVKVRGEPRRLASETELVLFRIAQEALRNAEKHSGASAIRVTACFRGQRVRVSVVDNGRGFAASDIDDLARSGKLGLTGMRERAQLIEASFSLYSRPGLGTRVRVEVVAEPPEA